MKTHEHNSNHEPADSFTDQLRESIASPPLPPADPALREALLKKLNQPAPAQQQVAEPMLSIATASRRRNFFQRAGMVLASTAALALVAFLWQRPHLPMLSWSEGPPQAVQRSSEEQNQKGSRSFATIHDPARTAPGDGDDVLTFGNAEGELQIDREVSAAGGRLKENPTDDYRSTVHPSLKKRYGQGGPQITNAPVGDATATTGTMKLPQATPAPTTSAATTPPAAESAPKPYGATRSPQDSPPPAAEPSANEAKPAGRPGVVTSGVEGPKNPASYSRPVIRNPEPAVPADPALPTSGPQPAEAGNGQQPPRPTPVPAGLLPTKPESRYYYESAGKEVTEAKTLDSIRLESEANQQLATNDAPLPQIRQVEDEVRQKFHRVVTLSDEIKAVRAKLRGDVDEKFEKKKLDELEVAIKEVREAEGKYRAIAPQVAGEQYARIVENQFLSPNTEAHALSTFSIDVDTASYANVRRFLNNGQLPPPDAVRIEELVNYFKYKYPQPKGDDPFSVNMEMADCPWHPGHKLLRVGLQGKEIHRAERPASNIVFLIDTSGSMADQNKLALLKQAFTLLVAELGENDKVTMVTYAGEAGLKLPPTRGDQKEKIIAAIESLHSGGSTHGSAGIQLAYEHATAQFIKDGTNKVILATDGDLNVGITDDAALVDLITKKKETGVFLTVLGVGTGNLKDAKMERLANNGNGNYAYLDSVREARKVLVEEMSGSLVTIAKDVKIQIEFNPAEVQSYRLLGYENRVMANQDFRNDAKDAGEIGAGHNVTAFYEVALRGAPDAKTPEDKMPTTKQLRYQRVREEEKPAAKELTDVAKSGELLTVYLRYKKPEAKLEDEATEINFPLKDKGGNFNSASADFQFASAVVAFGLSLRNSEFRGSANLSAVAEIATATIGEDVGGYRAEFLDLVRRAKSLRGE